MNPDEKKLCSSYHEAGHAVVAILLDIQIEQATIGNHPKYNGATFYRETKNEDDKYKNKRIITAYAGGFASIKYDPKRLFSISDIEHIENIATQLFAKTNKDKKLKVLENIAKEKVNESNTYIDTVAKALRKKTTLTGDEIRRIIQAS